jgi:hypothetical protein
MKTKRSFSAIALDQAQEQCIRREEGAVSLTNNSSDFRCWMVVGPEIARMMEEFKR